MKRNSMSHKYSKQLQIQKVHIDSKKKYKEKFKIQRKIMFRLNFDIATKL